MTPLPLTILHLLGFSFGLGLATIVDLLLLRTVLKNQVFTQEQYKMIHQLAFYVMVGLGVLWLSGLGFLLAYKFYSPEKICNPKVWAKFTVVFVLTVNGLMIHRYMLPKLKQCIGEKLIEDQTFNQLAVFCLSGVISMVSWYIPFIFGVADTLNYRFGYFTLILCYLGILSLAVICSLMLLGFLYGDKHGPHENSQRLEPTLE